MAVASATSDVYRAEAAVVLRSNSTENIFLPSNATPGDADRTLQTEAEIAQSARIKIPVEAAIGKPATYTVTPVFKADVLEFASSSSDASRAATVANAAAKTYVDERRKDAVADAQTALTAVNNAAQQVRTEITATNALPRVATGTTELDPSLVARLNALHTQLAAFEVQASELQIKASVASGGAQLIAEAQVPESPSSTSPVALGALGALLGLVVGALSALALERFSDKVEDTDDLESSAGGLAVLGEIPPLDDDTPLPIRDAPNSVPAEAIRRLRASLHLGLEDGVRTVQITSPRKGDGATLVAANLATAYAAVGHRVVIIDADMREGSPSRDPRRRRDTRAFERIVEAQRRRRFHQHRCRIRLVGGVTGGPAAGEPGRVAQLVVADPAARTALADVRHRHHRHPAHVGLRRRGRRVSIRRCSCGRCVRRPFGTA